MSGQRQRNPGPDWGFGCLRWLCRTLPLPILYFLTVIGSTVAWAVMHESRRASREYLTALHCRPPTTCESLRQFIAFTWVMLAKLRAGEGAPVHFDWDSPEDSQHHDLLFGPEQLLLGTFHVGGSEFLGFHGLTESRDIAMVRQRRDNAGDIEALTESLRGKLHIVWTQSGESVIFPLRDLLADGYSLAMQCDRAEDASKTAVFEFLGARRRLPVTIYRLALLYGLPVCFCVAIPEKDPMRMRVKVFPPFRSPSGATRRVGMEAARAHFQSVLVWLEGILRAHPSLWFNFIPLQRLAPTDS